MTRVSDHDNSKNIRASIEVTKIHSSYMPIEHARSLFKLSEALLRLEDEKYTEEARSLQAEAETSLRKRIPDGPISHTESTYDNLISIFWR